MIVLLKTCILTSFASDDIGEHGGYYLLHACSFYETSRASEQDPPRTRAMSALLRVAAVAARGVYLLEKEMDETGEKRGRLPGTGMRREGDSRHSVCISIIICRCEPVTPIDHTSYIIII